MVASGAGNTSVFFPKADFPKRMWKVGTSAQCGSFAHWHYHAVKTEVITSEKKIADCDNI